MVTLRTTYASACHMDEGDTRGGDGIGRDAIVDAAIDIIVRRGLTGLTLRPLASSLGVSVGVISAKIGAKDQLIERVIDLAAERDQHFFDRWAALAGRIAAGDRRTRAAVADLAFRDWTIASRQQAIILIELVHHRALGNVASDRLDQWLTRAGIFWSTLVFGVPALADLALGYMLD